MHIENYTATSGRTMVIAKGHSLTVYFMPETGAACGVDLDKCVGSGTVMGDEYADAALVQGF